MLVLFLLVLQLAGLLAQQPLPMVVPASEFFMKAPEVEAWDMAVDTNNVVIMASGRGVHRFNGQRKSYLERKEGTKKEMYPAIYEDAKGRLWAKGMVHGFDLVTYDGLEPHPYIEKIEHLLKGTFDAAWGDSAGNWHFSIRGIGYSKLDTAGNLQEIVGRSSGIHGHVLTYLEDGTPFHFIVSQKDSLQKKRPFSLYFYRDEVFRPITKKRFPNSIFETTLLVHGKDRFTLSMGNREVVHFTCDSLIRHHTFDHPVIKLFEDSRKNLWVGTLEGMFLTTVDSLGAGAQHLLSGATAVVAEDRNGGLWVKSNELKFCYIPRFEVKCYSNENAIIERPASSSLTTDYKTVYCQTQDGNVLLFGADTVRQLPAANKGNDLEPTYMLYFDTLSDRLWSASWDHLSFWQDSSWHSIPLWEEGRPNKAYLTGMHAFASDSLIGLTGVDYINISQESLSTSNYRIKGVARAWNFAVDTSGTVWLAGSKGLLTIQDGKPVVPIQVQERLRGIHCSYVKSGGNYIWTEINGQGLFMVGKDSLVPVLDQKGEQVSCRMLTADHEGVIWALDGATHGTVHRVYQVDEKPVVEHFVGWADIQYEINSRNFVATDEHLYLGSLSGVLRIAFKDFEQKEFRLHTHINTIRVNHQKRELQKELNLKHNENSIVLHYELADYQRLRQHFRTRMLGLDSTWLNSRYNSVQYTNLPPGEYTFQLQARVNRSTWSSTTALKINIQPAFYQYWWFRILCVLGLILIGSGLYRWWASGKEKRTLNELLRLKAEQRALRSQMNPHFIANALSSIQDLVNRHDKESAMETIALFSRLMRNILDHSICEQILLAEEIELLTKYLKLEKLRFEEKLQFEIELEKGLDPTLFQLPPLFLQPVVENAIRHGLMNKKQVGGKVWIRFKAIDQQLECTIEDNGVGRAYAATVQKKYRLLHRSFSTQSILERMELINSQRTAKITMEVTDLFQQDQPAGTRVVFTFPPTDPI